MASVPPSAHQQLATVLLQRPVTDWILEERNSRFTWREIAEHLCDITDGLVDLSDQTLSNWMRPNDVEGVA